MSSRFLFALLVTFMFVAAPAFAQVADPVPLSVSVTADTSFTRSYTWSIAKTVSPSAVTLFVGESRSVDYVVAVDRSAPSDSLFAVSGSVTIANTNPVAANVTALTLSQGSLVCPGEFVDGSRYLQPGETLVCTYTASLPDATSRTIVANVTTRGDITGASGSATAVFGAPTTIRDGSVAVTDSLKGFLGIATDDRSFTYSSQFGPYSSAGTYVIDNVATYTTDTNETKGSASARVTVMVVAPVGSGCTLTQGYWKNHLTHDAWGIVGLSVSFYQSGQTYREVMRPQGKQESAYYQLARQYVAARLNVANGADPSALGATMNEANALFAEYTPSALLGKKGSDPIRAEFVSLAGILASWNEGLIGPGHCD